MNDITFNFKNRVFIVTGAGSGMGKSICEMLLDANAMVCGIDISEQTITRDGYEHFRVDVTDEDSVRESIEKIFSSFGKIDGLVNAAGVFASGKPFYELETSSWEKVIDVNLKGSFLMSKYVSSKMIPGKQGRIVNISCIRSAIYKENMADYAASKAGVSALTSVMALDLAQYNIRVNSVAPGFIRTGMTCRAFDDPVIAAESVKLIPNGRIGQPEDIASVVMFLLSDISDYISGTTVFADGGYRIRK